ncbi:MAG: RHS repeat-associated core domain-containing protein [Acidobacteriota bacterium]
MNGATNRISEPALAAVYDGAGNLKSWSGVLDQQFDPLSMLREFSPSSEDDFYIYTAGGERLATKANSQQEWTWTVRGPSGKVLRQYNTFGPDESLFFMWSEDLMYRGEQLLAMQRVAEEGGRIHYHLDHLGTPRQLTSETYKDGVLQASEELSRNDYDPFGTEASSIRQLAVRAYGANSMQYTGHERDYHSGVYAENVDYYDYMHARFYQPGWGRFLSVDRSDPDLTRPQTFNRYAYALNNPIRYNDPTGSDALDTIRGAANAFASDMLFGAGRVGSSNADYRSGQQLGDLAALAVNGVELGVGGGGEVWVGELSGSANWGSANCLGRRIGGRRIVWVGELGSEPRLSPK